MKKLMKIFFVLVGAFIILGVVGSMIGGDASEKTQDPVQEVQKEKPVKAKPVEKKPSKKDLVTKKNYDKIISGDVLTGEGGMTIDQVKAILGKEESKIESGSGDMKMEVLTWTAGVLEMKSITVTFTNGKVSGKSWIE